MKRQPLLADRFIWSAPTNPLHVVQAKTVERVQNRLRSTTGRRFILDEQAVVRVGEVVRDIPDLLFRECQFARAPYDTTYVEFWFPTLWETINGKVSSNDCDGRFGFLIDQDSIYVLIGGQKNEPDRSIPVLLPISYQLHTPWSKDQRQAFAAELDVPLFMLDAYFWGNTFQRTGGLAAQVPDDHPQAALRNAHSARLLPLHKSLPPKILNHFILNGAGEFRNLIAILLLMNRPSLTTYVTDVPRHRGIANGKVRPYLDHSVITIALDPRPTLRIIGTPEGDTVSRRRHEVRGTWCNNYDAREYEKIGCVHAWRPDPEWVGEDNPDDPDHFVCGVCEGKRWWRDQLTRGDAEKGWVQHDYNVTDRTKQARRTVVAR